MSIRAGSAVTVRSARDLPLKSGLRRLEGYMRGPRCPECGLAPDERRPIAVIREEYPERSFEGNPYEACSSCKEPLYTVIRVVYE